MRMFLIAITTFFSISFAHAEDTPRQAADKAVAQAMAKAQAQKTRNDAIVAKQRTAEKAAMKKSNSSSSDSTKAKPEKSK